MALWREATQEDRDEAGLRLLRLYRLTARHPEVLRIPRDRIDMVKVLDAVLNGAGAYVVAGCFVLARAAEPMWSSDKHLVELHTCALHGAHAADLPAGLIELSHHLGCEGRVLSGDTLTGKAAPLYIAAGWRRYAEGFIH